LLPSYEKNRNAKYSNQRKKQRRWEELRARGRLCRRSCEGVREPLSNGAPRERDLREVGDLLLGRANREPIGPVGRQSTPIGSKGGSWGMGRIGVHTFRSTSSPKRNLARKRNEALNWFSRSEWGGGREKKLLARKTGF